MPVRETGIKVVEEGPPITKEQWAAVSQKLLDLLGSRFKRTEYQAISDFIATGRRAWPDLEKQAQRVKNGEARW